MKVAIVILHYFQREMTSKCLESVAKLQASNFNFQTIVVNNNPQEDLKILKAKFKGIDFLEPRKNLGFTGGNNLGIKKALQENTDFVLLLNNDTILDKDFLVQLIKAANSIDKSGILGPKIYFAPGCEFHKKRYNTSEKGRVIWYAGGLTDWKNVLASHRGVDKVDKGQFDKIEETGFVSGCAMLVKKEVFAKIGLLDEKYFLYLEDNDFCQRARRTGFKILYVPQAIVWHFNAASSEVGGDLHDYYLSRNRLLFGTNYAPLRTKIALLKESVKLLAQGRKWQKRGVKDFYLRRFGKGSYG